MAEVVKGAGLKIRSRMGSWVRIPLPAPFINNREFDNAFRFWKHLRKFQLYIGLCQKLRSAMQQKTIFWS